MYVSTRTSMRVATHMPMHTPVCWTSPALHCSLVLAATWVDGQAVLAGKSRPCSALLASVLAVGLRAWTNASIRVYRHEHNIYSPGRWLCTGMRAYMHM